MSGWVALLRRDGGPIDRELLARMTAAQRFRGPDGEGSWLEPGRERVGFGHTLHRSSIEAAREQQPAARGGKLFVTADARIDAREELCAALRARGIDDAREDATDPELILQAYEAWGEACVEHLLGDFSFALWDAREEKLLCAVDQLGVKPLFYADHGGLFVAANSLECVRLHPGVSCELNETAVGDFLAFAAYGTSDVTIYRDVQRVAPGHVLVAGASGLRLRRYFSLEPPQERRWQSEAECLEAFRPILHAAVRDRLRTPRVAVYMSGGVDSTLVAEVAKHELTQHFDTASLEAFTVVYESLIPDDERRYAQLAADALRIPIHFHSYDDTRLFDWAELGGMPEPTYWPSAGAWLREVRGIARDFPVLLSGWDGDSLFLSMPRLHWRERLTQGRLLDLGRELAWYTVTRRALPPIGVRTMLQSLRRGDALLAELPVWLDRGLIARTGLAERWSRAMRPRDWRTSRAPSHDNLIQPHWGRFFTHEDASVMGCALESRHPLLDLRVVRFALTLPVVPFCIDKRLLRRAMRDLPDGLRRRPKSPLRVVPDLATFRTRGLGVARDAWALPALEPFVDPKKVERGLERAGTDAQLLDAALRAVGLGVWLGSSRHAGRSPD
jgi:asparagine synthase (glutamine-hydrolysing)